MTTNPTDGNSQRFLGTVEENYLPRVVDSEMREVLNASPAVLIEGPRGCGKTWTGRRFAASEILIDTTIRARLAANADPAVLLEGPAPLLVDEWQLAPDIWNPLRRACDDRQRPGQFILTGSADPPDDTTRHSGAGRVLRVRMRPMSLYESNDSEGSISLMGLFESGKYTARDSGHTVAAYLTALNRLFVVEDLPAWRPHIMSRSALRKTPKRHFVDPSLAAAALGLMPDAVMADLKYAGLLFESMAVRDLRVYAQANGCNISHYRDSDGLEVDAVVSRPDGAWIAIEVKLGGEVPIAKGVHTLRRLHDRVDPDRTGKPARLVVLTAGGYGYEHPDGVTVVPITALGP